MRTGAGLDLWWSPTSGLEVQPTGEETDEMNYCLYTCVQTSIAMCAYSWMPVLFLNMHERVCSPVRLIVCVHAGMYLYCVIIII